MLAALGTSGTLETERGTGHLGGLLDMAGPKRACAFWALGSVGHQAGGRSDGGQEGRGDPLMVPGLQGSRSAQARFPRSAEPDSMSMSLSLSLSMSMSLISLE